MNIKNLSEDLISYIYSFIPMKEIYILALNKKIDEILVRKILFQKFPKFKNHLLNGLVNNYYYKCFICCNNLGYNYNLIMCCNCCLKLEDMKQYPIICYGCSTKKLDRGEYKFTFCKICNNPTSHLGITPFS